MLEPSQIQAAFGRWWLENQNTLRAIRTQGLCDCFVDYLDLHRLPREETVCFRDLLRAHFGDLMYPFNDGNRGYMSEVNTKSMHTNRQRYGFAQYLASYCYE